MSKGGGSRECDLIESFSFWPSSLIPTTVWSEVQISPPPVPSIINNSFMLKVMFWRQYHQQKARTRYPHFTRHHTYVGNPLTRRFCVIFITGQTSQIPRSPVLELWNHFWTFETNNCLLGCWVCRPFLINRNLGERCVPVFQPWTFAFVSNLWGHRTKGCPPVYSSHRLFLPSAVCPPPFPSVASSTSLWTPVAALVLVLLEPSLQYSY